MRKSIVLILGLVLLLSSTSLFGAGVSLTGTGARATALGGSYRAISDDWSAMFWNPAGLTQIPGLHAGISTELLWPVANYAASKWNGMNFSVTRQTETESDGKTHIIPAGGITMAINDQLTVGLGVWAPFGLGATWDLLDTENYNSLYPEKDYEDDLMVLDIHPTIAVKISDKISVGFGVGFTMADIMIRKPTFIPNPYFGDEIYAAAGPKPIGDALKNAFANAGAFAEANNHFIAESELTGDGTGFSANLGLMFQLTEKLQLGLSGRYYSDIELDGTVNGSMYFPKNEDAQKIIDDNLQTPLYESVQSGDISLDEYKVLLGAYTGASAPVYSDATAKATLPLPGDFGVGLAYKVIDEEDTHLLFAADFMYTQWSAWDVIDIEIDGEAAASKLVENWEDMYRISFGAEYKLNPMLTLRGAYYLEENAAVVETLTPTIPDINTRNVINVGLQINLIPGLALHASYERILIGDTEVPDWNYSTTEGDYLNMAGTYKMKVNNMMFGLGYAF